jgi:ribosome-associated protein
LPAASADDRVVRVTSNTIVPASELSFRFSRSGGPGGQHANRSETRVELLFDLSHSPSLSEKQRARAQRKLAPYVDKKGILHLVSESSRSQLRNREEVVERFRTLLRAALKTPRKRRPTKPSRAARERRLEQKKRRGEIKKRRRPVLPDRQ